MKKGTRGNLPSPRGQELVGTQEGSFLTDRRDHGRFCGEGGGGEECSSRVGRNTDEENGDSVYLLLVRYNNGRVH
jgi:hypothetical protein